MRIPCLGKETTEDSVKPEETLKLGSTALRDEETDQLTQDGGSDSSVQRELWPRQIDFLFACVGYAVGVGSIYRFPYICMRNGGGAFLIPYFMSFLICGIPLFCLELALGQFSKKGALQVWDICPLFRGLGYSMVLLASICSSYYNIILTWNLYYLFKSFAKTVPWGSCGNGWNTLLCLQSSEFFNASVTGISNAEYNESLQYGFGNSSVQFLEQNSSSVGNDSIPWNSPAMEFWRYYILQLSSGIDDLGGVRWELMGFYVLSWVIIFVCLFKGVQSMGKVAYVTATVPYVLLSVLLVRGLLLPGAFDGIKYFLIPDWKKLLNIRVWAEALLQTFYSLGPAWGGIITMASYNRFNNNCIRDGIFVSVVNGFTNFYGGFVIFSVIGFLAQQSGRTIEEVGASGIALGFIVYPEAIAKMPVSPLWAILFFTMMLTIGIDSQFGMFETMITTFIDAFPKSLRKRKTLFVAAVCVIEALIGMILCTRAGFYIFQFLDWYIGAFSLLFISLLECVAVSWIYGVDRFFYDISLMLGSRPGIWWKICWSVVTPITLLVVWIYTLVQFGEPYYYEYKYPGYTALIGWMIALVSAVPIPYFVIRELLRHDGTLKQRLQEALKPTSSWGPGDPKVQYKYSWTRENIGLTSIIDSTQNS